VQKSAIADEVATFVQARNRNLASVWFLLKLRIGCLHFAALPVLRRREGKQMGEAVNYRKNISLRHCTATATRTLLAESQLSNGAQRRQAPQRLQDGTLAPCRGHGNDLATAIRPC
jgi:hypothetical protein